MTPDDPPRRSSGSSPGSSEDTASPYPETPDIETSSEDYARRFAGPVGEYFLEAQLGTTLELLTPWPDAGILDVGGGHGQLAVPLVKRGFGVTVVGSREAGEDRLRRSLAPGSYTFCRGDLPRLPFGDRSFDVVVAVRLLPHVEQWQTLIAELCRVAKHAVIVDYPDVRSVNVVSDRLFGLKKALEPNTRPYRCFRRSEILAQFAEHGFGTPALRPQFTLPMVVHRVFRRAGFSRTVESAARRLGLTACLGSPVIARFLRQRDGSRDRSVSLPATGQ